MSSASTNFNPYLKWLGIRSAAPNHYQLLGIETYESDADVIVAAADRQMAHVRKYQNGPHSTQSQALLNELAAAKICLLTADQKIAYDVQLAAADLELAVGSSLKKNRQRLAAASIVAVGVLTAAVAVPWSLQPRREPNIPPGSSTPSTLSTPSTTSTSSKPSTAPRPAKAASDAKGTIQLVASDSALPADEPEAARPQPARQAQQADQTATPPPASGKPSEPADDPATSAPLVKVVDVAPAEASPAAATNESAPWEKAAEGRRIPQRPFADQQTAIARLLQSLYDRNIDAAGTLLDQVLAEAADMPKREEALRLEIIYFKVKEFWDKADQGLETVAVGDTLNYRGGAVKVDAKTPATVRLQAVNGAVRDFDTERAKIDADLAVALARANGEATGIMLDVMCGVFLAIDRQGDLNAARDLLKRARENGVPVELLLATRSSGRHELSDNREDVETAEPFLAAMLPVDQTDDALEISGSGSGRTAVPTPQVRRENLRMLRREAYRDQFAKRGPKAELELANRLFQDANRSRDDADARYVMYEQAVRLASKNGDAKLADAATRALVYNFACDEDAIRLSSLPELCKKLRDAQQAQAAFDSVRNRIRQLIEVDDFATSQKYLSAAATAASRSKRPEAARGASELEQQLSDLEDHLRNVRRELMVTSGSPDDATVHTILGLYELHKGRDEAARRHLLVCGHDGLARAAAAEQDMDGSAESQLAVADLWWQLCDGQLSQTNLSRLAREKAIYWYGQAIDGLQGVSKVRAATRIRG